MNASRKEEEPFLRPSEVRIFALMTICFLVGISAFVYTNNNSAQIPHSIDNFETMASAPVYTWSQTDADICTFASNFGTSSTPLTVYFKLGCRPLRGPTQAICSVSGALSAFTCGTAACFDSGNVNLHKKIGCQNLKLSSFIFDDIQTTFTLSGTMPSSIPSTLSTLSSLTLPKAVCGSLPSSFIPINPLKYTANC